VAGRPASETTRRAKLPELLATGGLVPAAPAPDVEILGIECDSRKIAEGTLFVAVRGFETDGHRFVGEAARRGAVAALVEERTQAPIPEIVVPDTRRGLGLVAHEFYGRPSERLATHGITGTYGKTTTSYLIDAVLKRAGMKTGVVGTLGYRVGDRFVPGDRTSPESLDLARLMASMVEEGVEAVTMEISSHALALSRTAGVKLDTATFTNLSRDHLDFHATVEDYGAAKRSLFELIDGEARKPGSAAALNRDDRFGRSLIEMLDASPRVAVVTFGRSDGDVFAREVVMSSGGTDLVLRTPAGDVRTRIGLIGAFNVMNALAAASVAYSRGLPLDAIRDGLADVGQVPGRLEVVDAGQDFTVVVDYAHTPDALEQVLRTVRDLEPDRLIVVFGCGGDRDRGKRSVMGEVAVAVADVVIVTSDNPRTEDPRSIIDEIVADLSGGVEVVEDRRAAIARAVEMAATGDAVVIAGKGHEDYQIVGREKTHFDDREEATAAVVARLASREPHGDHHAG